MEMDLKKFGQKIQSLRKATGLSQRTLSEEAGVAFSTIQDIESGVGNPTLTTLDALGQKFEKQLVELIGDRPTQPQCQKIPDLRESVGLLNHYLNAEQDTRLLALWILTDDDSYLTQYEKVSKHPAEAVALRRILSRP